MPSSGFDPGRRRAIGTLFWPAVAASCARQRYYVPSQFRLPDSSRVAVLAARDYATDLADVIGRGLRELGVDVRGRRVLLKPNMVEYEPGSAINTDPRVVAGAAVALRRAGAAAIVVGEGPGHRRDTEFLLTSTGLYDVLRDERVSFVDLNVDDVEWVTLKTGYTAFRRLALPATLRQADLVVSMPKLKTHHWAGVTASMKNLFGVVPGAVYGWPKNPLHFHGIQQSILDLAATVSPGLAIVDAIVGMEGDGPIMGRPRPLGRVVMGTDLVAVDATCARLMGFDPYRLQYLVEASRFLGNMDEDRIEQRGDGLGPAQPPFAVIEPWQSLSRPMRWWERTLAGTFLRVKPRTQPADA